MAKIPTWFFHGDEDNVVPLEESLKMVTAMRNFFGTPRISILSDTGHDCLYQEVLSSKMLYNWMFQQNKRNQA